MVCLVGPNPCVLLMHMSIHISTKIRFWHCDRQVHTTAVGKNEMCKDPSRYFWTLITVWIKLLCIFLALVSIPWHKYHEEGNNETAEDWLQCPAFLVERICGSLGSVVFDCALASWTDHLYQFLWKFSCAVAFSYLFGSATWSASKSRVAHSCCSSYFLGRLLPHLHSSTFTWSSGQSA